MLPFRNHPGPRALAGAGLAALFVLSIFAVCRTPARQSLLSGQLSPDGASAPVPPQPSTGGIVPIAVQMHPASYRRAHIEYFVTDLGSLAGASYATAISGHGKVVGSCQTPQGDVAFLWDRGRLRRLGSFSAYDINDQGEIVGFKETVGGIEQPLLMNKGHTAILGTLPGATSTYGYRINDQGQVVENSLGGPRMLSHAFVWSGRRAWPLWTLPGFASCQAEAINPAGVVAGGATGPDGAQHACVWRQGHMIELGVLPGGHGSFAEGIDRRGEVVGSSRVAAGAAGTFTHAFLWRAGRMMDLGALGGWPQSDATAINDRGQIVGSLERPAAAGSRKENHAFVWERGRMRDLNALIRPVSGWVLSEAVDINDRGQIVGNGFYKGRHRPFLLTPRRGSLAWLIATRGISGEEHKKGSRALTPPRAMGVRLAVANARPAKARVALSTRRARRPKTTVPVEKVAAYRAMWSPNTRRSPPPIPIGFEGMVVARSSRPNTYTVQLGNLSRDIYLGPGKRVKTGDEIQVRGVLQKNGVVVAHSMSRLGSHHHNVRVISTYGR